MITNGENAVLVRHSAMSGITRSNLSKFRVVSVNPAPPISVAIDLNDGGKSRRLHVFSDDSFTFYTFESRDGAVLYDTRHDVPCDMITFETRKGKFRDLAATRPWLKPKPEWDGDLVVEAGAK